MCDSALMTRYGSLTLVLIADSYIKQKELKMDFLLYWTIWEQIIFVLVVFSSVSVFGLYLVRILVPLE